MTPQNQMFLERSIMHPKERVRCRKCILDGVVFLAELFLHIDDGLCHLANFLLGLAQDVSLSLHHHLGLLYLILQILKHISTYSKYTH